MSEPESAPLPPPAANTFAALGAIDPSEVDPAARAYWEEAAAQYQAEHGLFLGGPDGAGFVWGPEGLAEEAAQVLGPATALAGRRVLELGCGAGQCGRWLAARGADVLGVDISLAQLRFARTGPRPLPVVAATATALPLATGTFDVAFSSYGAVPFVQDLAALFGEVRRVLRPGGVWAFATSHPIRWCFPDDPGYAGLRASIPYFDRQAYVERDEAGRAVYAEFHRTLADYCNVLVAAGFTIERVEEPDWPAENESTWGGWSPLRGAIIPGTLIVRARAAG